MTYHLKANDMIMTDRSGVVCTVIYGQDQRTPVSEATTQVLYVTYVPAGVAPAVVKEHHEILARNVRLFASDVSVVQQQIIG